MRKTGGRPAPRAGARRPAPMAPVRRPDCMAAARPGPRNPRQPSVLYAFLRLYAVVKSVLHFPHFADGVGNFA